MTFKTITLERNENLADLLLNRPEKLNAFTFLMMEELISALDVIEADDNLQAVIVSGAGRAFVLALISAVAKIHSIPPLIILQLKRMTLEEIQAAFLP